jgi:acetylornithine deacetylase/succinyl-diaminopimelate desuccinylase-like protein
VMWARIAARRHASRGGEMRSMINVGRIAGGANTNVVPDRCTIEIDRRLIPSETVDQAFAELRDTVLGAGEPAGTVAIELLTGTNGFEGRADGACVQALARAVEAHTGRAAAFLDVVGVFDGRYYADDGIEIIDFGPGEGHEGHAPNESVPLVQVTDAALIQLAAVTALLGVP